MREFQSNSPSSLLLDLGGPGPLHARLAGALRSAIRDGRLRSQAALPPSRALAAERVFPVGGDPGVRGAGDPGYLETRTGSGTRVRALGGSGSGGQAKAGTGAGGAESQHRHGTRPARPAAVPCRTVDRSGPRCRRRPDHRRPWVSRSGRPSRAARGTSRYLARARGAERRPGDLTVCGGATDGIARICRALARPGRYHGRGGRSRLAAGPEVAAAAGLYGRPVPVDEQGLRADLLTGIRDAGAVILTPAHQFPSGAVLSPPRRHALIDWARRTGALSSRTTTTPSSATTAALSRRCRAPRPGPSRSSAR